MKPYELVCVIDAGVPTKEIDEVKGFLAEKLGSSLIELDDMGYLPLAYPLNGQDQAYYLSYHISIDGDALSELKNELRLHKKIAKYFVYKMKESEKFVRYSDIKKSMELIEKRNEAEPAEVASSEEDIAGEEE